MDDIYKRIADDNEFGVEYDEKGDIQNFFTGQTVFLTGCTGYLGKVFVEKLFRSCPDVNKLYMIVRPKKESAKDRMKEYFQHLLFDKVRKLTPNFESKVVAIEGDISKEDLGLSPEDRETITNEVTIVIHAASNVKFDAPIAQLFRTNVLGTQGMLNLAKDTKNLKIFVYVSTAFSHCYRRNIDEVCYPSPADLKTVKDYIEVDEQTPGGINSSARKELQKPWPNMYAYSKAVAESLVENFAKQVSFRCIIFRPSIVLSTYQEPIPAWIGNGHGPTVAVAGFGRGQIHAVCGAHNPTDMVPSDMCNNALFAIIWDATVNREEKNEALVYNYGSSTVNQISFRTMERYILPRASTMPTRQMFAPYFIIRTKCEVWFWILHYMVHMVGAVLYDLVRILILRGPVAINIFMKLGPQTAWIVHFVNGNWRIQIWGIRNLWNKMSEIDKHVFYSDLRTLDWAEFFHPYWAGIRTYSLKDPITGDQSYLKKYAIQLKIIRLSLALLILSVLFYFRDYLLLLVVPFHNLLKLICCRM